MVPKLHPRGQSFKGACEYVLHDKDQAITADRLAWAATVNLATQAPEWAWREMLDTYNAQNELKVAAGRDLRGRKNTAPVLHFTLSWADTETPTPEQMKEAALSSLKAIGLGEHEALIAAHNDTKHPHVHIVVNTIHPQTGITAPLKFTKLALSKWAEGYERENGIHCDERIKNNAEREQHTEARKLDASDILKDAALDPSALLMAASQLANAARAPYVPVKHKVKTRQQWFDRKEIIGQMKAMRATIDAEMKATKDLTWKGQKQERDALDAQTEVTLDKALQQVKEHYRPHWRGLYRAQKREKTYLRKVLAYEARQKIGQKPSARQAMDAVNHPENRLGDLNKRHEDERRSLSRMQRADAKLYSDAVLTAHKDQFNELKDRQAVVREAERAALYAQTRGITFAAAKAALAGERSPVEERSLRRAKKDDREHLPTAEQRLDRPSDRPLARQGFDKATKSDAAPRLTRSEQIKRDMTQWRKGNAGKDFGREL